MPVNAIGVEFYIPEDCRDSNLFLEELAYYDSDYRIFDITHRKYTTYGKLIILEDDIEEVEQIFLDFNVTYEFFTPNEEGETTEGPVQLNLFSDEKGESKAFVAAFLAAILSLAIVGSIFLIPLLFHLGGK